jgi:hypothetical protein
MTVEWVMPMIAAFMVTRDMEEIRDDFLSACKMHHFSDEQIADLLGIGRGQFADQKALRQHLSVWRLKNLPLSIQRTFWTLHGKRLGLTVIEDSRIADLIDAALCFLNWFKQRRPLRMSVRTDHERLSA